VLTIHRLDGDADAGSGVFTGQKFSALAGRATTDVTTPMDQQPATIEVAGYRLPVPSGDRIALIQNTDQLLECGVATQYRAPDGTGWSMASPLATATAAATSTSTAATFLFDHSRFLTAMPSGRFGVCYCSAEGDTTPYMPDSAAPHLTQADGQTLAATEVEEDTLDQQETIVLTFSEAVRAADGYLELYKADDSARLARFHVRRLQIVGNQAFITHTARNMKPIAQGASYHLKIPAGAIEDMAGNPIKAIDTGSTAGQLFKWTGAADQSNDAVAPRVLHVDTSTPYQVKIYFSEAVDVNQGAERVRIVDCGTDNVCSATDPEVSKPSYLKGNEKTAPGFVSGRPGSEPSLLVVPLYTPFVENRKYKIEVLNNAVQELGA